MSATLEPSRPAAPQLEPSGLSGANIQPRDIPDLVAACPHASLAAAIVDTSGEPQELHDVDIHELTFRQEVELEHGARTVIAAEVLYI